MNIPDQVIYINEDKCRNSYSCVRACPVNAIEVRPERLHPIIIADRCIGCGLCYLSCSPGAIEFRDSRAQVKAILQSGRPTAALIAPSLASEFDDITDYRKFVGMIRKLGFTYVHEVSFGVDLVAFAYKKLFEESRGKYYITSNCPSIVEMIEKYRPHLVPNLAPLVSPMIATAMVTRDLYGEDIANVFIGPCIDIKEESTLFKDRNLVEAVLTFIEVRQLFVENEIQEKTVKMAEFDPPYGNWGALYPYPAGILQAADIKRDLVSSHILTASGARDVSEAVNDFDHHIDTIQHHFNLFFCQGCMLGPGMIRHDERYRRRSLIKKYAEKRVESLDKEQWKRDMDRWSILDLTRTFIANDQRIPEPSPEAVNEVMKIIGKEKKSEELNCNACGYGSCREFATTVAKGLAVPEMCHTYNLRNKQEYIETLRQTNKKLSETKKALKESEEQAMREKDTAQDASETMNSMLNKLPNGVVIVDNELKILHSNESFLEIIGEDAKAIAEIIPGLRGADLKTLLPFNVYNIFSFVLRENESVISRDVQLEERMFNVSIFPIRQNRIAGAVIRDLFSPEVQREEVITRVSDAIDKNLEMVQKIGFLLGEGASDTERMLNSIVEQFRQKKNEPGK
ncbi:MAG: [Fe-Fe] hydrogenase large subunit C-terminal domain-containing protein [Bacteroidales bacterium]|jgi:iron only hydrogenase large subunit-like protein|nr:[Fe-Fe] hydrogenase large subunit C-terminal domain-containing protein [Bacteroidales bacterium]